MVLLRFRMFLPLSFIPRFFLTLVFPTLHVSWLEYSDFFYRIKSRIQAIYCRVFWTCSISNVKVAYNMIEECIEVISFSMINLPSLSEKINHPKFYF